MSIVPIVKIDVDGSDFDRFYELFKAYSAEVDEQPEKWRSLSEAMGETTHELGSTATTAKDALAIAAAQAGIISEALGEAVKAQKSLGSATHETGKGMEGLRKSTEGLGKAISFVGGWIIKLGALGGLSAIFSGIGFADLASAAVTRGRNAGELGISPGLLASFELNASPFLTSNAVRAAADAQSDLTQSGNLATLLGPDWFNKRNEAPTDLAFDELRRARAAYKAAPKGMEFNMPAVAAYLALGGNKDDLRYAASQPLSTLNARQRATQSEAGLYDLAPATIAEWQILDRTLKKAGVTIETVLIDHLAPLAPKIAELAVDLTNFVAGFINSKQFDEAVKATESGLQRLATFLGSVDWKKIGDEVMWLADKLGWLLPTSSPADKVAGAVGAFAGPGANDSNAYDALWGNDDWADVAAQAAGKWWLGASNFLATSDSGSAVRQAWNYQQRKAATQGIRATSSYDVLGDLLDSKKTHIETALGLHYAALDAGGKLGIYDVNSGHGNPHGLAHDPHLEGWAADITDVNGADVTAVAGKAFSATKAWLLREIAGNRALTALGLPAQYEADAQIMAAIKKRGLNEFNEPNSHVHEGFGPIQKPSATAKTAQPTVKISITNPTSARVAVVANAGSH